MNISEQLPTRLAADKFSANTIEDEHFWHEHIERYSNSDLSKAKYAKCHKLNYARFLYWYNKSKKNNLATQRPLPVKLKPIEINDELCSINIGAYKVQIYDLSVLDHLLKKLS